MKWFKWLSVLLYAACVISIAYGMLSYWLDVSVFTFQSTVVTAALHIVFLTAMISILVSLIKWRVK